jgi:hypothetical protein
MKLESLIKNKSEQLVDAAMKSLERAQLAGYLRSSPEENQSRFSTLLVLLGNCVTTRDLAPMKQYAQTIASDRFRSGFDLQEVFTAFNVLEEQIWKRVVEVSAPEELATSLGLMSTVLGAGKECLSVTYVNLASKTQTPSLNLTHLFEV